jgi:DNA-binding response OmpR family regulator
VAKILVADDEPELRELLRFSLDVAGHLVTAVSDGKQALEAGRTGPFDLIILDVMMPHMDGYHVSSELSNDPKSPPILLLTSRDYTQDQAAIKGSGAAAFLSKPFEINELLEAVNSLLKKT